jgi:hypothetical protein
VVGVMGWLRCLLDDHGYQIRDRTCDSWSTKVVMLSMDGGL